MVGPRLTSGDKNMGVNVKRALIPAAVMGFVAAIIFGTPELITTAILTCAGFVSAMLVIVVAMRLVPVDSWRPWKQRVGLWLIATGAAAGGCALAISPIFLRR